ncbi:diguanylate cyclase [Paenibacillus oenotherae]|uniref:Diguanylate cyclase n=1 Tax=Paenibacillus oenotherae TaxID=1435645 RepID=A0ABS7DB94_9BACL|nr:diguanylate cyclase [Paenibacillus oenotherae]MBW7476772.1 diguanylate cyclase [Paenibacillus oenotherae]
MGLLTWLDPSIFFVLLALFMYVFVYNTVTMLHRIYLIFHFLIMIWPLGQFAVNMTDNPHFQLIYNNVSFVVLSVVGFGWQLVLRFLINPAYVLSARAVMRMFLPALVIVIGIAVNPGGVYLTENDGGPYHSYGPLFWILALTLMAYFIYSAVLLIRAYRSGSNPHYRPQIAYALTGVTVLVLFGLAELILNILLSNVLPAVPGIFTIGIAVASICFVAALHKQRSFDIVRIAQQDVIDTIAAGIIVLDRHEQVVEMNRMSSPRLGIHIGSRLDMERLIHSAKGVKAAEPFLRAYRSNPPARAEMEISIKQDGRIIHLSMSAAPIMGDHNRVLGRVITFQDITELRRLIDDSNKQNEVQQERNRELLRMQDELFQANGKLEMMAITDSLTGCYNRRYLMQQLEHEVKKNVRYRVPFAIILFDIDLFKSVNDTYGHLVGDDVIRLTAEVVRRSLRQTDILARYGGEEFTVYLPHTNGEQAAMLAKRICEAVEANAVPVGRDDETVSVTISVGVLSVSGPVVESGNDAKSYLRELFARADAALYEAKEGGRNRIIHYQE